MVIQHVGVSICRLKFFCGCFCQHVTGFVNTFFCCEKTASQNSTSFGVGAFPCILSGHLGGMESSSSKKSEFTLDKENVYSFKGWFVLEQGLKNPPRKLLKEGVLYVGNDKVRALRVHRIKMKHQCLTYDVFTAFKTGLSSFSHAQILFISVRTRTRCCFLFNISITFQSPLGWE